MFGRPVGTIGWRRRNSAFGSPGIRIIDVVRLGRQGLLARLAAGTVHRSSALEELLRCSVTW